MTQRLRLLSHWIQTAVCSVKLCASLTQSSVPDLLPMWTYCITCSFVAVIITMANRGRCLARNINMSQDMLLSQSTDMVVFLMRMAGNVLLVLCVSILFRCKQLLRYILQYP